MRRFSQRNSLVTLNEINITPLLDLAFVLLIIFVITRPLLEQSMDLQLPKGMGAPNTRFSATDGLVVEISPQGRIKLNGTLMSLDRLFPELERRYNANPKSFIAVRADENGAYKHVAAVLDGCQKRGLTRFSLKTFPDK